MQRQEVALEVSVPILHRQHMPSDFLDHIRDERFFIGQEITITGLIETFGRKIYLETPG